MQVCKFTFWEPGKTFEAGVSVLGVAGETVGGHMAKWPWKAYNKAG